MAFRWQPALCVLVCLTAAIYVSAQDQPPLTTLTFDQPLNFSSLDGSAIHFPGGHRLSARSAGEGAYFGHGTFSTIWPRAYSGTDCRSEAPMSYEKVIGREPSRVFRRQTI